MAKQKEEPNQQDGQPEKFSHPIKTPTLATAPPPKPRLPPPALPSPGAPPPPKAPKWRAGVWTICFAAVTIMGTIYGAGLKTRMEWKTEKKKVLEATTDERIAILENRRSYLIGQKMLTEKKIADIRARMAQRAAGGGGGGGGGDDQGTGRSSLF